MPNIVLDLKIDRVDLVDDGSNSEAFILLTKRKETVKPMTFDEIMAKLEPEHATVIKAAIDAAKAEVPEQTAQDLDITKKALEESQTVCKQLQGTIDEANEMAKRKAAEENEEELIKSLPPAAQALFSTMQKNTTEALEKLTKIADEQDKSDRLSKAKELSALPIDADKLADMLKGASPDLLVLLQGANKLIADSAALGELGKKKAEVGGDAWDKIEKMAKEIATKESITFEEATKRVIKEQPDLYKEYLGRSNE